MNLNELKKLTLDELKACSRPLGVGEIIQEGDWFQFRSHSGSTNTMFAVTCFGEKYKPSGDSDWYRPVIAAEIKLGWYHSPSDGSDFHVVYVRDDNCGFPIIGYWRGQYDRVCTYPIDYMGTNFKYLGTELPEQGEWVSPDDVRLSELPIRARTNANGVTIQGKLLGFVESEYHFRDESGDYWATNNCQVWRAK